MNPKRLWLIPLVAGTWSLGTPAEARARRTLGIVPAHAPAPPQVDDPTMSMDERRRILAEGDRPEFLLAMPYTSSGRHFATRWYDERGQVYRSREVAMVLRTADNGNIDHHLQWRQSFLLTTVPTFGVGLLLAGDQLGLGVQHYNYQQAAAVRTKADSAPEN